MNTELDFVRRIDKNLVEVFVEGNWQKITRDDLKRYLKGGLSKLSGVAQLGGIVGDWRMIDMIAEAVIEALSV